MLSIVSISIVVKFRFRQNINFLRKISQKSSNHFYIRENLHANVFHYSHTSYENSKSKLASQNQYKETFCQKSGRLEKDEIQTRFFKGAQV